MEARATMLYRDGKVIPKDISADVCIVVPGNLNVYKGVHPLFGVETTILAIKPEHGPSHELFDADCTGIGFQSLRFKGMEVGESGCLQVQECQILFVLDHHSDTTPQIRSDQC